MFARGSRYERVPEDVYVDALRARDPLQAPAAAAAGAPGPPVAPRRRGRPARPARAQLPVRPRALLADLRREHGAPSGGAHGRARPAARDPPGGPVAMAGVTTMVQIAFAPAPPLHRRRDRGDRRRDVDRGGERLPPEARDRPDGPRRLEHPPGGPLPPARPRDDPGRRRRHPHSGGAHQRLRRPAGRDLRGRARELDARGQRPRRDAPDEPPGEGHAVAEPARRGDRDRDLRPVRDRAHGAADGAFAASSRRGRRSSAAPISASCASSRAETASTSTCSRSRSRASTRASSGRACRSGSRRRS